MRFTAGRWLHRSSILVLKILEAAPTISCSLSVLLARSSFPWGKWNGSFAWGEVFRAIPVDRIFGRQRRAGWKFGEKEKFYFKFGAWINWASTEQNWIKKQNLKTKEVPLISHAVWALDNWDAELYLSQVYLKDLWTLWNVWWSWAEFQIHNETWKQVSSMCFGDFLINSLHCSNSDKFRKLPYQMYAEKKRCNMRTR